MISLTDFTGEFPRSNPSQLPPNAAQLATDCDFASGTLRGVPNDASAGIIASSIKAMFVYNGGIASGNTYWWARDVDAVRSPVVNDKYNRFYWTDDTGFYVSNGTVGGSGEPSASNRYKVGVPRPETALSASSVKFTLPGMAAFDYAHVAPVLYDERSNRKLENAYLVGSTPTQIILTPWQVTATKATLVFTARSPQPESTTTTTSTTSTATNPAAATAAWKIKDTVTVGAMMAYRSATRYVSTTTATQFILYYEAEDGGIQPQDMRVITDAGDDFTYYRLNKDGAVTNWYGSAATIVPPSKTNSITEESTTATKVDAPYSGPALQLTFTLDQGGSLTAIVRTDSNKTTWPVEFGGVSARLSLVAAGTGFSTYTLTIGASSSVVESRGYTYTYVNQYEEEGAPAPPVVIDCASNSVVTLGFAAPPTGYCPVYKVRLYRTATGSTTNWLYVGETLVSAGLSIVDNVRTDALGRTLDTQNYYPPDQGIVGLRSMSNGMLVGFKGNEVHIMEPYLPYACNPSAIKPLPHRIVGICPFEGGLYVTTTAEPYILMGAAPEYMTDAKVAAVQAGVSKWAICNIGNAVAYASNDGIVLAQGMTASLDMSFKFWTRKEWQAAFGSKLSGMRLSVHDGSLLLSFNDGSPAYLLRIEEETPSLARLTAGYNMSYAHHLADSLYVASGATVNSFRGASSRKAFDWQSKDFIMPKPVNMAVIQFVGTGTISSFSVIADGVVRHTKSGVTINLSDRNVFRLPSGFTARRWSVRIVGAAGAEINEIHMATSMQELQNG